MLKLYNDLTKKKESLKIEAKTVKMYSCGPTIYDYAHIGNLRTFTFEDLLVRYLKYKGNKVIHVRNLTDVEDKIIKALAVKKQTLKEYTDFYAKAFFEDTKKMHFLDSSYYPRATEYVEKIVDFIFELMRKGFAYKSDDGSIYFNIVKFKDYGKLSGIKKSELKGGASGRIHSDEYSKEEASDFVLWKAYTPKDGNVFWETRLGKGRPGWHIECSVMANSLLGKTIDIHTGGEDLIFPHHENEVCQSEAHNSEQFAKFWIHSRHLLVNGTKMSKSLGNFYTLRDLETQGFSSLAVKLLFLSSHYKSQLNLTIESLQSMQKTYSEIQLLVSKLCNYFSETKFDESKYNKIREKSREIIKAIEKSLDDDLNTASSLSYFFDYVKYLNTLVANGEISTKACQMVLGYFEIIDSIFGIFSFSKKITKELEDELWQRYVARKSKDFATSDKIRKEFEQKGYLVSDLPTGFTVVEK